MVAITAGKTSRRVFCADLVLERPRPFDVHPLRQVWQNLLIDDPTRLLDEPDLIATPDIHLDVGPEQAVLALDDRGALDDLDLGEL